MPIRIETNPETALAGCTRLPLNASGVRVPDPHNEDPPITNMAIKVQLLMPPPSFNTGHVPEGFDDKKTESVNQNTRSFLHALYQMPLM